MGLDRYTNIKMVKVVSNLNLYKNIYNNQTR